eukprot:Blabericola_migrator_1__10521@NODE_5975_length_631_cov_2_624113_g3969_i0_p1_GENE_NODE_5975_length_631_cov_2_624113_g3969_i0NODE_5975_length_631_cov_2_624113_g3969_i0_p1_ORF_typecomplete_len107_score1_90_NODE_5975_length_631_cov_2_624113_g3969_i0256576
MGSMEEWEGNPGSLAARTRTLATYSLRQATAGTLLWHNEDIPTTVERRDRRLTLVYVAEEVRFELTDGLPSPVFKTGTLNHSVTPPSLCHLKRTFLLFVHLHPSRR